MLSMSIVLFFPAHSATNAIVLTMPIENDGHTLYMHFHVPANVRSMALSLKQGLRMLTILMKIGHTIHLIHIFKL